MGRASRTKEQRQKKFSPPQTTPPSFCFGPKDLPVRSLAVLLLLSVLAALIYSNTFSIPFQFDDADNIVQNPQVKDLANFYALSGSRYVGFLSFALNYSVGGLQVFGYHLVNRIIHIANGFLVYSLVLLLFKAESRHSPLTTHNGPLDCLSRGVAVFGPSHPDPGRHLYCSTVRLSSHPVLSIHCGLLPEVAIGIIRNQKSVSVVWGCCALHSAGHEDQGEQLYTAFYDPSGGGGFLSVLHEEAMDSSDPLPADTPNHSPVPPGGHR